MVLQGVGKHGKVPEFMANDGGQASLTSLDHTDAAALRGPSIS